MYDAAELGYCLYLERTPLVFIRSFLPTMPKWLFSNLLLRLVPDPDSMIATPKITAAGISYSAANESASGLNFFIYFDWPSTGWNNASTKMAKSILRHF